ncbi:zinc finger, CCHC-type containing protein [Tanacetum coccineum]
MDRRWATKMFIYLNYFKLAQFLNETAPQVEPPKRKANMVKQTGSSSKSNSKGKGKDKKKNDKKSKGKSKYLAPKAGIVKQKFQGTCHNCDQPGHRATNCKMPTETGSSSRLDEEVVQDKRQRDDNDLHNERQDQLEEEEVEPRRSKRARTEKSFGPDFVSFMVEKKKNEPTLTKKR